LNIDKWFSIIGISTKVDKQVVKIMLKYLERKGCWIREGWRIIGKLTRIPKRKICAENPVHEGSQTSILLKTLISALRAELLLKVSWKALVLLKK